MLRPIEKLRPEEVRQVLWDTIRGTAGSDFTTRLLCRKTWAGYKVIKNYLMGLSHAGYLKRRAGEHRGKCAIYRLARDPGVEAPRVQSDGSQTTQGRTREQLWRTMRILVEFTPRELAITASTPDNHITRQTAGSYINRLHAAGYLRMTVKSSPGSPSRYMLMRHMYTGPKPPLVQQDKQVYDPNLRRVVLGGEL
jgi:hypothetical protein